MAQPKAYEPEQGYKFQILCRHPEYNGREWEHCDIVQGMNSKVFYCQENTGIIRR